MDKEKQKIRHSMKSYVINDRLLIATMDGKYFVVENVKELTYEEAQSLLNPTISSE